MKSKLFVSLAAACVAVFTGCMVPSLNPLFAEKDLVAYSDIIGNWSQDGKDEDSWKFEKDGKTYKLTHWDEKKRKATFTVSIGKIGTNVFMDVFPSDERPDEHLSDMAVMHLVPAHTFLKVQKQGAAMNLVALDLEWTTKTLKDDPKMIAHVMRDNYPVLTASTEELQRFVGKLAANTNAFKNTIELQPRK